MEQTLSIPRFSTSPFSKCFPKWRKRSTRNQILQAFQASLATAEKQPPLLHLQLRFPSHGSLEQVQAHLIKIGEEWNSCSLFDNLLQHMSSPDLLETVRGLHRDGVLFSDGVLITVLEVCGEDFDVILGSQVHALITKRGLDADSRMRCAMMDFYEDAKMAESCDQLFREAAVKDVLLWSKQITLSADREEWLKVFDLFRQMQFSNLRADVTTIQVLNVCGKAGTLNSGKEIHGRAMRTGVLSNTVVSNSLITMYAKNFSVEAARRVFEYIDSPSLVSWNSMISGYCINGCLDDALKLFDKMISTGMQPDLVTWNCLFSVHHIDTSSEIIFELFRRMQMCGIKPNSTSITSVLQVVCRFGKVGIGKEIHGYALRHGLTRSLYVSTALLDMYSNLLDLRVAQRIFDGMEHKNIVSWNSMISAYANEGSFQEALQLLKQMEREGIRPNLATWNGLISGYAMKGKCKQALILIRQLRFTGLKGDVVSWTALISGCSQNRLFEDSLAFFAEMQNDGVKPNSATLVTVLRSCASLGLLKKGSELHCYATRRGLDMLVHVSTGLIDMYCKSGSLRNAHQVFRMLEDKNVATWNAMILGFANYGKTKEAFLLFEEMLFLGIKPDSITFTAVLTGCRHSGLIDAGWKYFDDMKQKYNISPTLEHYAGMADLLARGGFLDEALDFIKNMPFKPDAGVWGSLLCACKTHRNLRVAEFAAKHLLRLEPRNSANYMLMIAIYASENQWEDVHNVRVAMNRLGVKTGAGWSWLQIGQTIHSFSVEGQTHPEMGTIYFELYQLVSKMKVLGYVPDTSCIVHNIREEEKKKLLMAHTEKLAITYGLIKTSKGMPLRVVTNIRACNDCHMVAKLISQISGREIFLRDGVRVHHFKQGQCSCNDYW